MRQFTLSLLPAALLLLLTGCVSKERYTPSNTTKPEPIREGLQVREEITDEGVRYYTFMTDRPYRIDFRIRKADVDGAEHILKEIDMEAYAGNPGKAFGINNRDTNFSLLYWRDIYNKVYNQTRGTVERLAQIFRRIKNEEHLNDAQTIFMIVRFVQFMKYDLPPGVGIYSPVRALFELGKGNLGEPPSTYVTGWNGAGDCDTKSLLLAMLLQACGYRAVVLDSYRYQHAMVGVDCPGADGVFMEFRGIRYYFVETTYPNWNIGQMPPSFSDIGYFYPIDPREDHRQVTHIIAALPDGWAPVNGQGPSEREPNDDMASADSTSSLVIRGALDEHDTSDWFLLNGQESTVATFTLVHASDADFIIEAYNNGVMVASSSGAGNKSVTCNVPGRCHLHIRRLHGSGSYTVFISPGGTSDFEPNDTMGQAKPVAGNAIFGQISSSEDVDWYLLNGQEGFNATYTLYTGAGSLFSFEVYNDGSRVGTYAPGSGSITVDHPGRVSVRVWSGGGTGWYLLTFERNR